MTGSWPATLVLAGCGRMGGALLRGWVAGGVPVDSVHVLDPLLDHETVAFCRTRGISLRRPTAPPEALVLAVKPQSFAAEPEAFAPLAGADTMVLSILAGGDGWPCGSAVRTSRPQNFWNAMER